MRKQILASTVFAAIAALLFGVLIIKDFVSGTPDTVAVVLHVVAFILFLATAIVNFVKYKSYNEEGIKYQEKERK